MNAGPDQGRTRGLAVGVGLVALAAFGLRLAYFGDVYPDDPPYHLLRVWELLNGLRDFGLPDPRVAHPGGAVVYWPWGFDVLLAGLAWPFLPASPSRESVSAACQVLVPVLGAGGVLAAWALARSVSSPARALAVAAVLAFLPAHVTISFAGRVDHHVLEPLLLALAAAGAAGAAVRTGRPAVLWAALGGLLAGVAPGFSPAVLPVAVLEVAAFVPVLSAGRSGAAEAWGLASLAGAALSLLLSPLAGEWVPYTPSRLHLAVAAVLAAASLGAGLRARLGPASSRLRPLAAGALAALAAGLAVVLASPGLVEALRGGLGYIGANPFATLTVEAQPLLSDLPRAATLLTPLAPAAPLGGLWLLAGRRRRPVERVLGALALAATVLALYQRRFLIPGLPFLALAAVAFAGAAWDAVSTRLRDRPRARLAAALAGVLALAVGGSGAAGYLAQGEALQPRDQAVQRVAESLRDQGGVTPGQGVLAPWYHGHVFQWVADAPTVCDGFWGVPVHDRAFRRCLDLYLGSGDAEVRQGLDEARVEWIVVVPPGPRELRAYADLTGRDPSRYLTRDDRFKTGFGDTLWGALWRAGESLDPGAAAPFSTVLVRRVVVRDEASGAPLAEAMLFRRRPPSAD
jgi:asparagine N-glycosylation enzyme membrane subunit Stt3